MSSINTSHLPTATQVQYGTEAYSAGSKSVDVFKDGFSKLDEATLKEIRDNVTAGAKTVATTAAKTHNFLSKYGTVVKWAGVAANVVFNPVLFTVGFCGYALYNLHEKAAKTWMGEMGAKINAGLQPAKDFCTNTWNKLPDCPQFIKTGAGKVSDFASAQFEKLKGAIVERFTQGTEEGEEKAPTQLADGLLGVGLASGILFYPIVTGPVSGAMSCAKTIEGLTAAGTYISSSIDSASTTVSNLFGGKKAETEKMHVA
jgi:hypothetical protein